MKSFTCARFHMKSFTCARFHMKSFTTLFQNMSTLLSELDSSPPKDGDLVDQILKEMNGNGHGSFQHQQPSPAMMMPSNPGMPPTQMSNTVLGSHIMDNGPATAHMIGGSQPTPADFVSENWNMKFKISSVGKTSKLARLLRFYNTRYT